MIPKKGCWNCAYGRGLYTEESVKNFREKNQFLYACSKDRDNGKSRDYCCEEWEED